VRTAGSVEPSESDFAKTKDGGLSGGTRFKIHKQIPLQGFAAACILQLHHDTEQNE
jgi:hypothetical protein